MRNRRLRKKLLQIPARPEIPVLVDAYGRPLSSRPITRRNFVRTSSGIIVAAGLGGACSGTETGPGQTGSVQVTISGLDPSAPDGGTVTVTALDVVFDAFTVTIPASGDSDVHSNIPVGHYRGSYAPPAGYALAPSETNPKDATISAGQLTVVTWAVVAAQGTVRVSVSGLAADAPNGGSASVLRTDISGQSPVVLAIPASGSADLGVTVGTYQVTYTPPNGYNVSGGVQNPQSVDVASGAVATVSFGVSASGTTFQTPDLLNNASFEAGWDRWTDWSGSGTPSNVTRDTAHAYAGSYAVKRVLLANQSSDEGAQFIYNYGARDEVYLRFYFYLDNTIGSPSILKFFRFYNPSFGKALGGFFLDPYGLIWVWDPELASTGFAGQLVPWSSLALNAWHSAECRYRRNGDPSGFPAVQIWFDNVQLTTSALQYSGQTTSYWSNGWFYPGLRSASDQLGYLEALATHNAKDPNQTNLWVDRIAFSSAANGRIGP